MREIVTYQSIKENPNSAQDSNVSTYQSIKENPKSAQDTNVSINKRES